MSRITKSTDYVYDCIKDYPECKYRASEWVRTKMPYCKHYEDHEPDPKKPVPFGVDIKTLLAVQFYVNKPTVFYYVTKIRNEEYVKPIQVCKIGTKWIVDDGTHRVEAYLYLGRTQIPAIWGRY